MNLPLIAAGSALTLAVGVLAALEADKALRAWWAKRPTRGPIRTDGWKW